MENKEESDALLSPGAGPYPSYGAMPGKERIWSSALCCVIACFASFTTGVMMSFSSSTVLELDSIYRNGDTNRGVMETSTYASLIGSFGALGALFGGPFAWLVSDRLGRKPALMLGGVFALVGWLLISFAHFISGSKSGFLAMFLVGRLLTSFAGGWAIFCVSVYTAEVASAKLKGLFGACNQLFMTLGQLVGFALGALTVSLDNFAYYHVAIIAAGFVVIFEIFMLFTRETPRWLFVHGKDMVGSRVLQILRGPGINIQKEVGGIKRSIEKSKGLSFADVVRAITHRSVYVPFILGMMLMSFQQLSGINVAIFYAGTVFKQVGTGGNGPDAEKKATIIATISVGVVQVLMTFVSVVLIDYLGRRVLLIVSSTGALVSTLLFGTHFFIVDHKCHGCLGMNCIDDHNVTHLNDFSPCDSANLGWLAIVSLTLFIAAFSIGLGPVPWLAMSELLPMRVRGLLGSVVTMWSWLLAFIITSTYHTYANAVTTEVAWWSFSVMMFLSIFFVFFSVPETKGHMLEEINFEQGHTLAVLCKWRR